MRDLQSHFEQSRADFAKALAGENDIDGLVRVSQSQISALVGANGQIVGDLTVREHAVTTAFFNSISAALDLLRLVTITSPAAAQRPAPTPARSDAGMISVVPRIVGASAGAMIGAAAGPAGAAAGAAAGDVLGMTISRIMDSDRKETAGTGQVLPITTERARLEIGAVRDRLPRVLEIAAGNFDRIGDEFAAVRDDTLKSLKPQTPRVEDVPNVLPLLHDLMSDDIDPEGRLKQYAKLSERIMKAGGIQCAHYEPGVNDHMFDIERVKDSESQIAETAKPALVRDGQLLARGTARASA
jgi:hypothetical protein